MSNITLEQAARRIKYNIASLNEAKAIVEMVNSAETKKYIDDHNGGGHVRSLENWVLVEWNNKLCPFPVKGMGACLNPLYIGEDGEIHLSKWSIGPYFSSVAALDDAGVKYYTI